MEERTRVLLPLEADLTIQDVRDAKQRIGSRVHETPVMHSKTFDERATKAMRDRWGEDKVKGPLRVFFKCENLQRGGAFKIRGALNKVLSLSPEERARGIVAFSSGNHAQAVAIAAKEAETVAFIAMPQDAPRAKLEATRGYGANVFLYDRMKDDREAFARKLAEDNGGLVLVPPYDDPFIMAGQGTCALELFDQISSCPVLSALSRGDPSRDRLREDEPHCSRQISKNDHQPSSPSSSSSLSGGDQTDSERSLGCDQDRDRCREDEPHCSREINKNDHQPSPPSSSSSLSGGDQTRILDAIVTPCGGGGLFAGCSTVARALSPETMCFAVEAETANDTFMSLQKGERVCIDPPPTIADGMRNQYPGKITFPILQRTATDVILVTDEEIVEAMKFLLFRMKLLVEPTGAASVAAVLFGKLPPSVCSVGVVISGGNVDPEVLLSLLSSS